MDQVLINVIALIVPVFFCAVLLSGTYGRLKLLRDRISYSEVADALERYHAALGAWAEAEEGRGASEAGARLGHALDAGKAAVERFWRDPFRPDAGKALDVAWGDLEAAWTEAGACLSAGGSGQAAGEVAGCRQQAIEAVCAYNRQVLAYDAAVRSFPTGVVALLFGFRKGVPLEAGEGGAVLGD